MTTSDISHHDVGAYALGVLDAADAERFENHLAACDACAEELAALLPVAMLLDDARGSGATAAFTDDEAGAPPAHARTEPTQDPATPARPEPTTRTPARPEPTAPPSRSEPTAFRRRRGGRRFDLRRMPAQRLVGLAAAVVVVLVAVLTSVLAGWPGDDHPDRRGAQPGTSAQSSGGPQRSDAQSPLPTSTFPGDRFTTTDPATGVHLELSLDARPWGTQVYIKVVDIFGPRSCKLVITSQGGAVEEIATWRVPVEGYGTTAQPKPLQLMAATEMARGDMRRVELRAVGQDGVNKLLTVINV